MTDSRRGLSISYGLGSLGTNIFAQAFSAFILFFYIDHLHAALGAITAAMAVQSVWHAVLNPVVGWLSDRTKSRFGRRLPYIALFTLPLGFVFWLLWRPFVPRADLALYFLVVVALFDLFYLVTVINWTSLFPEIFETLDERARVESFRQGFGIAALMVGVAAPPILYGRFGWSTMGLILAIIGTAGFIGLVFGLHPAARRTVVPERRLALKPAIQRTLTQPGFLRYLGTNFLVQFVLVLIPAGLPFFAKYVLHVTHGRLTIMLAVTFVLAILLVRPWAGFIVRVGSRRAFRLSMVFLTLGALPFFVVRNFAEGVAALAVIGVGLSGFLMLVDIIMAEIIDDDARRVGERREGVYYGLNGLVLRFGTTLESLVLYVILTVTHYHANAAGIASPAVVMGFRILMAGVPLAALLGAMALFHGYRVPESRRTAPAAAAMGGPDAV
jgi:GPH family glycoside/pentoside/hexuronide:cation symporter